MNHKILFILINTVPTVRFFSITLLLKKNQQLESLDGRRVKNNCSPILAQNKWLNVRLGSGSGIGAQFWTWLVLG